MILSDPSTIDAGSPGGALSQVYIIAEFMRRLKERLGLDKDQSPADYFDLIGGSGLGAYVLLIIIAVPMGYVCPCKLMGGI